MFGPDSSSNVSHSLRVFANSFLMVFCFKVASVPIHAHWLCCTEFERGLVVLHKSDRSLKYCSSSNSYTAIERSFNLLFCFWPAALRRFNSSIYFYPFICFPSNPSVITIKILTLDMIDVLYIWIPGNLLVSELKLAWNRWIFMQRPEVYVLKPILKNMLMLFRLLLHIFLNICAICLTHLLNKI